MTGALQGYLLGSAYSDQYVGVRNRAEGFEAPVTRIRHDDKWLWLCIPDMESYAQLPIDALPELIRALDRIRRARDGETVPDLV